jgi:hypothetical protein
MGRGVLDAPLEAGHDSRRRGTLVPCRRNDGSLSACKLEDAPSRRFQAEQLLRHIAHDRRARHRGSRGAFNGLCDDERMPVICPTCQVLGQSASVRATAGYFAWGCFRYFGATSWAPSSKQSRSRRNGAALPLPLAGEGWGGGARPETVLRGGTPTRRALPRASTSPASGRGAAAQAARGHLFMGRAHYFTPSSPPSIRAAPRHRRASRISGSCR